MEDRRFLLVVSLQDKVTETQAAAARILDAVAAGTADVSDPALQRSRATLTADLRRELQDLGRRAAARVG